MSRIFIALLLVTMWADGHAQSSLPPCPTSAPVEQWSNCTGTYKPPDGHTYTGEFQNGKRNGQGALTLANGARYVGGFRDSKYHGRGIYTWPNKFFYSGDFVDGKRHGIGAQTNDTGRYYGEWIEDHVTGKGVKFFKNGDVYSGGFREGEFFGFGTYFFLDGRQHVGEWNIKPSGEGVFYNTSGIIEKTGLWENGVLVSSFLVDESRFPRSQPPVDTGYDGDVLVESTTNGSPGTGQSSENQEPGIDSSRPNRLSRVAPQPPKQAAAPRTLRRVALIIGNARYTNAPILNNPPADAASVAAALREAGFQTVTVKTDLSQQSTLNALREFASLADTADWAVVYYAGHGIEFGGVNYLIPTDARLKTDRDIDLEGVDLGKVMSAVEGAKRLRLIILDACRDNPFANQMRRTMASRSLGRGLARVEPEPGTLVAYAAKHGETADDGTGTRNSPFAEAFVKRIKQTPPIEVRRLFDYVRDDVLKATNKRQQPFSYGSISAEEDFYFLLPK